MKKILYVIASAVLSIQPSYSCAAANQETVTSFNFNDTDADLIDGILQQSVESIPQEVRNTLDACFQNESIANFFRNKRKEELDQSIVSSIQQLSNLGMKCLNQRIGHTYLFTCAALDGYIIKAYAQSYFGKINWWKSREIQCITRPLFAHLARSVIEEHCHDMVYVPRKYLYHIPGTPEDWSDLNYVVVVEFMNCESLEETKKHWVHLMNSDDKEPFLKLFRQMEHLITKCALWDSHLGNCRFIKDTDVVAFLDLEKPSNELDEVFLKPQKAKFKHNIKAGLEQLYEKVFFDSNPDEETLTYLLNNHSLAHEELFFKLMKKWSEEIYNIMQVMRENTE